MLQSVEMLKNIVAFHTLATSAVEKTASGDGQKVTFNIIKQRLGDLLYKITSQKFEDPEDGEEKIRYLLFLFLELLSSRIRFQLLIVKKLVPYQAANALNIANITCKKALTGKLCFASHDWTWYQNLFAIHHLVVLVQEQAPWIEWRDSREVQTAGGRLQIETRSLDYRMQPRILWV